MLPSPLPARKQMLLSDQKGMMTPEEESRIICSGGAGRERKEREGNEEETH